MAKVSFSFEARVVDAIKHAVREGRAESASAFVESAIREKLQWTRREVLSRDYAQAAQDQAFIADVDDTVRAYDVAADDGLTRRRRR